MVVIKPQDFSKPTAEAIEDEINAKYANKVVYNIGLCICLYDLLKVSEGLIGYGNGSANVHGGFIFFFFFFFFNTAGTGLWERRVEEGNTRKKEVERREEEEEEEEDRSAS